MSIDLNTKSGRAAAYKELTWGDHGFLRVRFNNMHEIGGGMYRANLVHIIKAHTQKPMVTPC